MEAARNPFDVFVVGGGLTGCAIARDAAGRGLSVYLAEQGDFPANPSFWVSNLLVDGLAALGRRDRPLLRALRAEREILWRAAPHIVRPLRTIIPYRGGWRPDWKLRLGFLLSDMVRRESSALPRSRTVSLRQPPFDAQVRDEFAKGLAFYDCIADDPRLIVLNALDAAERGAVVRSRTRVIDLHREAASWTVTMLRGDRRETVHARALVLAAGQGGGAALGASPGESGTRRSRITRHAQIVVPKLYEGGHGFAFRAEDGRLVSAVPIAGTFTMVGTSESGEIGDRQGDGRPDGAISPMEIEYLCAAVSSYLRQPLSPRDVLWSSGGGRVRAENVGDARQAAAGFALESDIGNGLAPRFTVAGAEAATHRLVAETVVDGLCASLKCSGHPWTATASLPGGDFASDGLPALVDELTGRYPFLAPENACRLAQLYGTRATGILGQAKSAGDLGRAFGGGLTEAELRHLGRNEWAQTAEDVVWRRSKLGLRLDTRQIAEIDGFMSTLRPTPADA